MNVQVATAVRFADLGRVDMRQPVVRRDLARHVEDQAAQRIALVGVGVDAPVGARQVFVDRRFHIDQRLFVGAQRGVAFAVHDVAARRAQVVGGNQGLLDHVLDLFDAGRLAMKAVHQHLADLGGEQRRLVGAEFAAGRARALKRRADFFCVKSGALAAALGDLAR